MGPVSAEIEVDVPRERAFEALADLAGRPSFTDHFQTDFHLTRIDSAGVGAGARFRVRSPLRSVWMDTAIAELDAPHRIVEHGRGGRANRIPTTTVWDLQRGPRLADQDPRLALDRALKPGRPGAGAARRQLLLGASGAGGRPCAGCATCSSPTPRPRHGSRRPGATATRPAFLNRVPAADASPATADSILPLLAALALAAVGLAVSACGYSSDSKDVKEGEPVKLGDVQYNVVFSRYLNPNDNEDSAFLVGQPEAAPRNDLLRRLLRSPERKRRSAVPAGRVRHRRRLRPDLRRAADRKPLRLPARRRSRSRRTDPGPRLDRPAGVDRGLPGALLAAGLGLRQPAADARNRRPRRAGRRSPSTSSR